VLNKIDGLWDGLRPAEEIDAEIDRQVDSCGRILGIPPSSVFAVSAQKGLVAKIGRDPILLEKSRLPQLEDALADGLLPAKQEIVARGTAAEARQLAGEVQQLLATRRAAVVSQLDELMALRGKNESMVAQMVTKAKLEKETYEKGLREYYAVRSVYSRLSETLFSHLGLEALRAHARRTRETMRQARFTPQLLSAMGELFSAAGECLDASESDLAEISTMMKVMRDKFGKAYGVTIEPPAAFSLANRRRQLNHLEVASRRQYSSVIKLLTNDKRTLTQQFFETIVSQIRRIFDHANRDAEHWLRALMTPLENQVREVQRQMRHRLDNVRRIHEAAEGLEDRIEELAQDRALLDARLKELAELEAALDAALRPPQAALMRAAA
jgi:primosomal protein N''